jgi:cytoskeletal protein CcmA (bactofilin family)
MSDQSKSKSPSIATTTIVRRVDDQQVTLLAEGTEIEGRIVFGDIARVFGRIQGDVVGKPGSQIVLGRSCTVEGRVSGDSVIVDGTVKGEIHCTGPVEVSATGRVLGDITAPQVQVSSGAHVQGKIKAGHASSPA